MYIISKKKDYYDGVAGTTGIDKTIVYDRQIIEVEEKDFPLIFKRNPSFDYKPNPFYTLGNTQIQKELKVVYGDISYFIIGFCGKLYPGWKLYSEGKPLPYGGKELIITIEYDSDIIRKLVEQFMWQGNFDDNLQYVKNYDALYLFRELNTPVFLYDQDYGRTDINPWTRYHPKFIINPLLKEYQFFRVFETVQAFQEIQMFLSGVLGNKEKEIVNVADKYKIAQHGFDKWSFRKESEKK
jgi:hypothetical protein